MTEETSLTNNDAYLKQQRKTDHALSFMSSVQSLRSYQVGFDFFIHVQETVIPVHRLVLISFSEYFRGMLQNDTKEALEGKVEMKDVDAYAIKECIEFMYNGDCTVTSDSLCGLIHSADMLQLEGVKTICFSFMKSALSVSNCVIFHGLAKLYVNNNLLCVTVMYFTRNFSEVGQTADFKELSWDDARKCVCDYGSEDNEKWQVGITWISYHESARKQHIFELVKAIGFKTFPSRKVLSAMWGSVLFKDSAACVDFMHRRLYADLEELKKHINYDNCIFLSKQAHAYEDSTAVLQVINDFMKENLGYFMAKPSFSNLHKDDFVTLMSSSDMNYNYLSETEKWSAIIGWFSANRVIEEILLQNVDFNRMPKRFIEKQIVENPFLRDKDCYNEVMQRLVTRQETVADSIAVLLGDQKIYVLNLLNHMHRKIQLPTNETFKFLVSVNNRLCAMSTSGRFFSYRNRHKWSELPLPCFLGRRIVELNDCVFLISQKFMHMYTPVKNCWISYPGCRFDKYSAASSPSTSRCDFTKVAEPCVSARTSPWSFDQRPAAQCSNRGFYFESSIGRFTATTSSDFIYAMESKSGKILKFDPDVCEWSLFDVSPDRRLSHIIFAGGELGITNGKEWMFYSVAAGWWCPRQFRGLPVPELCDNYTIIQDKVISVLKDGRNKIKLQGHDLSCGLASERLIEIANMSYETISSVCAFKSKVDCGADSSVNTLKRRKLI